MPPYDQPTRGTVRVASERPRCSCELLATLAGRGAVADVLARFGIGPEQISSGSRTLHRVVAPEPADWRVRLEGRGGAAGHLDQLLAIVRSADSHAYQLLEQLGAPCTSLRRHIIERTRAMAEATAVSREWVPAARPPYRRSHGRARSPRVAPEPGRPCEPVEARRAARSELRRSPTVEHDRSTAQARPSAEPRVATRAEGAPQPASAPAPAVSEGRRLEPIDPASLQPLFGRDRVLARLADALGRRVPRAPLVVGPPGSGRTCLAMHLARVLSLPVYRLEATQYDEEDALREDLDAVANAGGVAILDDLDRVVADVAPPVLGALTQAWSSGNPPVVSIVSPEGQGRLMTWFSGAAEALDLLSLEPLEGDTLLEAVRGAAPGILAAHGVSLAPDAKLGEVTRLADRFLTGLAMPGRALDLLDLACARAVRTGSGLVTRQMLLEIVSERSGLPQERIELRGDQDVLDLEHRLARRVVGHQHVTSTIARLIRRNRAGFGGARPILTALLLGPSGVGKTEIAKALGAALFDREDAIVRLDMSEYSEPHAVARVVGAPPGYVGHEQGGALTDPLLARPHCVVLLDEIEKAHRDVHQLLLQVLDDGRLTDGRGRTVDFRHAAIIMTSNLGAGTLAEEGELDEDRVLQVARAAFPVELWNRIEAPLVMHPLTAEEMSTICRRLARTSSDRLFKERGIRYALSEDACAHLVALAGSDPNLGARPLRHLLTREIESTIADAILRGRLRAGTQVEVYVEGGRIALR